MLTFNIKLPKRAEFAEWITEKETALKDNNEIPEGWKYRGTFCTQFSNFSYEYLMQFEIDKYARLDDFRKTMSNEFRMIMGEFTSFLDGVPHWEFYESSFLMANDDEKE